MISPEALRGNPRFHLERMILSSGGTKEHLDKIRGYSEALRDLKVLPYLEWLEISRQIDNVGRPLARPDRRRTVTR